MKTSHKLRFNWLNNDIILIAGKGHETYQEINGVRHHFDIWKQ
jgi:UDP-N-acetylmuramyl tripeptide synthase